MPISDSASLRDPVTVQHDINVDQATFMPCLEIFHLLIFHYYESKYFQVEPSKKKQFDLHDIFGFRTGPSASNILCMCLNLQSHSLLAIKSFFPLIEMTRYKMVKYDIAEFVTYTTFIICNENFKKLMITLEQRNVLY